jgi:hypothetical protein
MLHAELHNKLSSEALDHERNEDILTSTVFGVLLTAEGGLGVLRAWCCKARFEGHDSGLHLPSVAPDYRFWPHLEGCVPDVALAFGDIACVVESKFLSGASDVEIEEESERRRQLVTEWNACASGLRLAAAFRRRDRFASVSLLYVVDGVRGARASADAVQCARGDCRDSRIGLLFWQDLHRILLGQLNPVSNNRSWVGDLALLLRRRQLGTFAGFESRVDLNAHRHSALVKRWRQRGRGFERALSRMNAERASRVAAAVQTWRSRR